MIRNNQNGRRRGRGGGPRPQQPGAPRPEANYGNRNNDARQRGNASQLLEKYKAMARDAQQAGDRVAAEYFMQYADHYYRVLNEFRGREAEQRPPQQAQRRDYDDGYADERDEGADGNAQGYARDDEGEARDDVRSRDDGRSRDDYGSQDQRRDERFDGRQGDRNDERRGDRQEMRRDGNRNGAPRREPRRAMDDDAVSGEDDLSLIQGLPPRIEAAADESGEAVAAGDDVPPAPRRRGRPRKDAASGTLSLSDA